ncbi:MAG TPA: multidrug efflux SMR transporter [Thermomicrobiales bacterium]|nr:multidrug efflux SMR transporter [Thermomicrobiales bacterium]
MGFSRHRHRRGGRRHTALRYSNGFTVVLPSIVTVAGYALAFFMLSQALRTVDLGIAYAVWAGIGTAAIALISMVVFGEPGTMGKMWKTIGLVLIIAGVVLVNLQGAH